MRTIYQTTSLGDAELLRVELRSLGIESTLHNEHGGVYAAGIPIPAIPFEVAVADEDAEAAVQAVGEFLFRKKHGTALPSPRMVSSVCKVCGKSLEVPEGEDAPSECPWCGPPRSPARFPVFKIAAILVALTLVAGWIFRRARDPEPARERVDLLRDVVGERAARLPNPEPTRVNPEAIATRLGTEYPEAAARHERAFAAAKDVESLVKACVDGYTELGPDWALDLGLAEPSALTRYTPEFYKLRALMEAVALKRARVLRAAGPSLDAELLERWLEGDLAWFEIHGPHPDDPRQAYVGITASFSLLDSGAHATFARRLAQVPDVLKEARSVLRKPPKLWIEWALYEIPGVLALLDRCEKAAPEAASAARAALKEYQADLEARLPSAGPARVDPRWLGHLVGDLGLTPAEMARALRNDADDAAQRLHRLGPAGEDVPPNRSLDELVQAYADAERRARERVVQEGFADAGAAVPLEIAPPHFKSWPGNAYYVSRPLAPDPRPRLYVEPWPDPRSALPGGSAEQLLSVIQGETWPGRHHWRTRARGHASLIKRLYGTGVAEAGWASYVRSESATREGLTAIWKEAWWGLLDLAVAGGTLSEEEAVDFVQEWARIDAAEARREVAYLSSYPGQYAGAAWTARELRRLRDDRRISAGRAFDLRRFHESVMDFAATPIPLIRRDFPR